MEQNEISETVTLKVGLQKRKYEYKNIRKKSLPTERKEREHKERECGR